MNNTVELGLRKVVQVIPDWERDSVDYASPPSIDFLVTPPFDDLIDRVSVQYRISDNLLTNSDEAVREIGASVLSDMRESFAIRVSTPDGENHSVISCTFYGSRRLHVLGVDTLHFIRSAVDSALEAQRQ